MGGGEERLFEILANRRGIYSKGALIWEGGANSKIYGTRDLECPWRDYCIICSYDIMGADFENSPYAFGQSEINV